MQIVAGAIKGWTILDLSGDIDLAHSPTCARRCSAKSKEKRTPKVFLNLKNVRYIDSSGIASLVEAIQSIARSRLPPDPVWSEHLRP